jgi:hypothetical protein
MVQKLQNLTNVTVEVNSREEKQHEDAVNTTCGSGWVLPN